MVLNLLQRSSPVSLSVEPVNLPSNIFNFLNHSVIARQQPPNSHELPEYVGTNHPPNLLISMQALVQGNCAMTHIVANNAAVEALARVNEGGARTEGAGCHRLANPSIRAMLRRPFEFLGLIPSAPCISGEVVGHACNSCANLCLALRSRGCRWWSRGTGSLSSEEVPSTPRAPNL